MLSLPPQKGKQETSAIAHKSEVRRRLFADAARRAETQK